MKLPSKQIFPNFLYFRRSESEKRGVTIGQRFRDKKGEELPGTIS
jgi:hypothetical protein